MCITKIGISWHNLNCALLQFLSATSFNGSVNLLFPLVDSLTTTNLCLFVLTDYILQISNGQNLPLVTNKCVVQKTELSNSLLDREILNKQHIVCGE